MKQVNILNNLKINSKDKMQPHTKLHPFYVISIILL